MQDAMLVRIVHRAGQLCDEFCCATDRHRFAPGHFIELSPLDEVHAEVAAALALADVVNWDNAWMVQTCRSLGFETESLEMRLRRPLAEPNDFYRDWAVGTLVSCPKLP